MFLQYKIGIQDGPTSICVCCGGTWFPHQVKYLNKTAITQKFPSISIDKAFYLSDKYPSASDKYVFCGTCHRVVSAGIIPTICLSEGLDFPEVPSNLKDLTILEERLISPRIPFMRIIALGYERQCAIRGAVVNVPISVVQTVTALPRTFANSHVIQVHLKRRLAYEHSFMTETIRPGLVLSALNYLMESPLYIKHSITRIDPETWSSNIGPEEEVPFVADSEDESTVRELMTRNGVGNVELEEESRENINPGGQETLLDNEPVENYALQE